jgi:hypothetical protein
MSLLTSLADQRTAHAAAVVEALQQEEGLRVLTLAGLDRAVFDSNLYIEFRVQVPRAVQNICLSLMARRR